MSPTLNSMSDSLVARVNVGAYDRPFSGVGIEFDPLGIQPGRTGITLHETGFHPANAGWNFPGVFSPFWRFYFNTDRGHCVLIGEQMAELTSNRIILVPPHCLFHCLGQNPVAHFWITFSFTRHLHPETPLPVVLPPRDTELCLIRDLKALVGAQADGQATDAVYRNSLALLQVVLARPELQWQAPLPENLARVRRHIENRFANKLRSPVLARLAGLSVAGFNRAFRRHFGTSPARHVTETRVREAARLLLQSDDTIEAIADRTGFPNRAYFSRVFNQVTGEAPASFRRKHRPQER
jgi:AraC family transcriptional regulator, arabinose operon regulatory protein